MTQLSLLFLLIFVPAYIAFRAVRSGAASVFNFSLYPLIFSYFYLLVPSLVPFVTTLDKMLSLSSDSFEIVDQLGAWSVGVFLFGYFLTKDSPLKFNEGLRLSSLTLSFSRFFQVVCVVVSMLILARHGSSLYALSGDRALSYEYYAKEIMDVYKLPVLFSFCAVASTLLYLRYGTLRNLAPLLPFAVLDALQGGRGYTFAALIVFGLNYLAVHMERFKRVMLLMASFALFLFASAFVRRYLAVDDTSDPWVVFFGEFFFTRLTAQFTFDNLAGHGDLLTYFFVSVSKLFPQFLVAPLFNEDDLVPYHAVVNDWTGVGFGLAGSIMSESLYYGGIGFGVVSPMVIAAIFCLMQRSRVYLRLPGYLFFIVLSSSMYLIFRTGFYTNFFSFGYMFIFYFSVMILPSYRCSIFLEKIKVCSNLKLQREWPDV